MDLPQRRRNLTLCRAVELTASDIPRRESKVPGSILSSGLAGRDTCGQMSSEFKTWALAHVRPIGHNRILSPGNRSRGFITLLGKPWKSVTNHRFNLPWINNLESLLRVTVYESTLQTSTVAPTPHTGGQVCTETPERAPVPSPVRTRATLLVPSRIRQRSDKAMWPTTVWDVWNRQWWR